LNRILSDNQEIINHKQLRFGPEWGDDSISVNSVVAKTKMRDDKVTFVFLMLYTTMWPCLSNLTEAQ